MNFKDNKITISITEIRIRIVIRIFIFEIQIHSEFRNPKIQISTLSESGYLSLRVLLCSDVRIRSESNLHEQWTTNPRWCGIRLNRIHKRRQRLSRSDFVCKKRYRCPSLVLEAYTYPCNAIKQHLHRAFVQNERVIIISYHYNGFED